MLLLHDIINTFIYSCVAELDDDVGGVGKVGDTQGIRKRVWSPALVQNLFTLLTILHLLSDLISDWIIQHFVHEDAQMCYISKDVFRYGK